MAYRQEPPFALQIELVEGCQIRCYGCGLNGIREPKAHNFKFMDKQTLRILLKDVVQAGWNCRVEFAMHGEPTMHPDYVGMIAAARRVAPRLQLMMTSNGGGLLREPGPLANLEALFDAGLNVFAFDAYEYINVDEKVMSAVKGTKSFDVYRYPENPEASVHKRWPLKTRALVRLKDIVKATTGNHSVLNNHCGAGLAPLKSSIQARCAKPFRELAVRWDGNVAICCNDWRGIYKIGNVIDNSIDTLWQAPEFKSARRFLMVGDRAAINPCRICDAKSYRVGLLPDKKGKAKLRKPDGNDLKIVTEAAYGEPYTAPVLRPWEKKHAKTNV
jgi:radical SAM protein with 4Fe4S-binding SPASM domain